jgi:hypothetical protein
MEAALEELCILACEVAQAARVSISYVRDQSPSLEVIARSTGGPRFLDAKFALSEVTREHPVLLVPVVADHPTLAKHPIVGAYANMRSLAAYWIYGEGTDNYVLAIWNPSQHFFNDPYGLRGIDRIIEVLRDLMASTPNFRTPTNATLHENSSPFPLPETKNDRPHEPASRFLIDTLVKKQRLLARNGCAYLALRQWRKPLKPYQIDALAALKQYTEPRFEVEIAAEMSTAVKRVYGDAFQNIVPVPGGSSGQTESFSVRLARRVATNLNITVIDALVGEPVPRSSSHPKKSSNLKPYKVVQKVAGNTLIIDDVATSGRHIELATQALRPLSTYCTSLVWIAD